MRFSTLDEYTQIEPLDDPAEFELVHAKFPCGVVVECDFPEWDVANRWCWLNFGPCHGACDVFARYPACPLILATEHLVKITAFGKEYEQKRYSHVAAHDHVGIWTTYLFGKTDYDHGFGSFCFSNENDKSKFVEFVPHVDWGENFPWVKNKAND